MTTSAVTSKGNQGEGNKGTNDSAGDPPKDSRRFNPYGGMDPSDPNFVKIQPEEFQEMMSKKKAMGIPSLEILKEKTKDFNLQPDASVVPNEKSEEHTTIKTVKIEKEDENSPPAVTVVPSKWKKFLKMQKAGVPNEAILQLAKAHQKTPTKADLSQLRELLGMKALEDDEADGEGIVDANDHENGAGYPPRSPPPYFKKFLKNLLIPAIKPPASCWLNTILCSSHTSWKVASSNEFILLSSKTSSISARPGPLFMTL